MLIPAPADAEDETRGQRVLYNEAAMLAERWGWEYERVLRLSPRTRRAFCYRVKEVADRERTK